MNKIFSLFSIFILIISFQNCSGVDFFGGSSNESAAINSDGSSDAINGLDGGSGLAQCFSYNDRDDDGPCATSLSQTKVVTRTNANGDYLIRVTFPKEFVDNTYGVNSIGWGNRGHRFRDLVGSDHVVLNLSDASGALIISAKLDYISEDRGNNGAYITGVEKMEEGNEADILEVQTSLHKNFNEFGYVLVTDSPVTDQNFSADPNYPNWIYDVWYEVKVSAAAFQAGGGFGQVDIESIHASPSKISENTCELELAPCVEPLANTCEDNPDDPDDDGICDDILD